ncbi:MAG: serine hydrolase [Phycisphaera sp.]|nr:serine hydrolase [Phycisphaera sp.]
MRHTSRCVATLLMLSVALSGGCSTASGGLTCASPEMAGMSSAKLAQVGTLMNRQVADAKLAGGVVAIARDGKVVYLKAFGQSDIAAGKPMQIDTIVRLYSMTKATVTAAALMLVDEGKIDLDAPVSTYIPALAGVQVWTKDGLVAPKRPILVRDLMRHTAGFEYGGNDPVGQAMKAAKLDEATDLDDFVTRLASCPLAYQPGERWIYSYAVDVLGLVVQKASGEELDVFLHERLFDPLGMVDTGFYVPADKLDRFAACYTRGKDGLEPIDKPDINEKYHSKPPVLSGGGGLVGTASDYMRFLLMIANGGAWNGRRYLKPETVALMTHDQLPPDAFPISFGKQIRYGTGFGLGFNVRTADTEWDPAAHVGEYGWGGAASTHYWVSPRDGNLIVVTLEQIRPYNFDTEWLLKPVIYDAIKR